MGRNIADKDCVVEVSKRKLLIGNRMTKRIITIILLLLVMPLFAGAEPEMADAMRSNGKIYVVVTVLAVIFAGIFAYLVYLDRKISRLEKEKNHN